MIDMRVGTYLRLSFNSSYQDSDSIENQRRLLEEYLKKYDRVEFVLEYVDDGKSGTSFDRPAFLKMMEDIRQGLINCVMVKDLSRFGREYLETGAYLEKIFPAANVRFISVNDEYDSFDVDSGIELMTICLKNLMHELYAKDISKKVTSTYQMKQYYHQFYRSAILPYGYRMEPGENVYQIDEPAANIIKEIFRCYLNGMSRCAISSFLYEKRIATPKQYANSGKLWQEKEERKRWSVSTIDRMLKNA